MAASNSPTLVAGEKTVTAAGTALALASANMVKGVTIIAKAGNTGQVYVGGADVASTTNDGLAPDDSLELPWALDLADIYIDSDVNGEGVDYYARKA